MKGEEPGDRLWPARFEGQHATASHQEHSLAYRTGWARAITDGTIPCTVAVISAPERIVIAKALGELVPTVDTADAFDRLMASNRDLYGHFESELLDLALGTESEDQPEPLFDGPLALRLPDWFRR